MKVLDFIKVNGVNIWRGLVLVMLALILWKTQEAAIYASDAASEASSAKTYASDALRSADESKAHAEEASLKAGRAKFILEMRFGNGG